MNPRGHHADPGRNEMSDIKQYFIGDDCVCWSLGTTIDPAINRKVLYLYRRFKTDDMFGDLGIRDVVPAYKGLAVYFDPAAPDPQRLVDHIHQFLIDSLTEYREQRFPPGKTVTIPVTYDGEDLGRVASLHRLTASQVIKKHVAPRYQIAMIGFRPYFPYLIGLDPDLVTARLEEPRIVVPAGSVAIGGAQTGIYPEDSPGGWNIIGTTNPSILRTIEPGDTIIFEEAR